MITTLCLMLTAMLAFTPAPSDMIPAEMILIEVAQDGAMHKSGGYVDHGQCKRFQYDTFAEVAPGYMLASHPEVALVLPHDHAEQEASGRPVGTCWEVMTPAEGNAFVEVARFDYDRELTQAENAQKAREMLKQVRAGDMFQMLARYSSGGRGTHTIMFTQPYDPRDDMLYWADSNFANTRIDGVRYGYVRAYQSWPVEEVVGWLVHDWHNGATIYRVSDDVVRRDAAYALAETP